MSIVTRKSLGQTYQATDSSTEETRFSLAQKYGRFSKISKDGARIGFCTVFSVYIFSMSALALILATSLGFTSYHQDLSSHYYWQRIYAPQDLQVALLCLKVIAPVVGVSAITSLLFCYKVYQRKKSVLTTSEKEMIDQNELEALRPAKEKRALLTDNSANIDKKKSYSLIEFAEAWNNTEAWCTARVNSLGKKSKGWAALVVMAILAASIASIVIASKGGDSKIFNIKMTWMIGGGIGAFSAVSAVWNYFVLHHKQDPSSWIKAELDDIAALVRYLSIEGTIKKGRDHAKLKAGEENL